MYYVLQTKTATGNIAYYTGKIVADVVGTVHVCTTDDINQAEKYKDLGVAGCIVDHLKERYDLSFTEVFVKDIMSIAECQVETIKHIEKVRYFISFVMEELRLRAVNHDGSKLESPEVETFAEFTPKLAGSTYGSDEYREFLKGMDEALQHHYECNRHHPEHFENGINDMNLVDIVEMICDWKAASMRHNDGNIYKSIEINAKRFGYGKQLEHILLNTAKLFDKYNVDEWSE